MASITGKGSKGHHTFTLSLSESNLDPDTNTSKISFSFTVSNPTNWYWDGYSSITYSIWINGSNYTGNIPSYIASYNGYVMTIRSGDLLVEHNEDGNKTISYSFSVSDPTSPNYTPGNASANGTMKLAKINRNPLLKYKISNAWVVGKVRFKASNEWKNAKKIYEKVNNEWKESSLKG